MWFFLCPILYPLENVPEAFRFTMILNPVAIFTKMYQDIFLYGSLPSLISVFMMTLVSLAMFTLGCLVFNRYREGFAELV